MGLIKPEYYNKNGVDVIEMIRLLRGEQAAKEFCIGNIYKYTTRFDQKNGLEDLHKAKTYLERLKELERSNAENEK